MQASNIFSHTNYNYRSPEPFQMQHEATAPEASETFYRDSSEAKRRAKARSAGLTDAQDRLLNLKPLPSPQPVAELMNEVFEFPHDGQVFYKRLHEILKECLGASIHLQNLYSFLKGPQEPLQFVICCSQENFVRFQANPPLKAEQYQSLKGVKCRFKIVPTIPQQIFTCQGPFLDLKPLLEGKELAYEGTSQSFFDRECRLLRLFKEPQLPETFAHYWSFVTEGFQSISREDEQKVMKCVKELSDEKICELLKAFLKESPDHNFAFLFNACQGLGRLDLLRQFSGVTPNSHIFLALRSVLQEDPHVSLALAELWAFILVAQDDKRELYVVEHQGRFVIRWKGLQLEMHPEKTLETLLSTSFEKPPLRQCLELLPKLRVAIPLKIDCTPLMAPLLQGLSHPFLRPLCHQWLKSLPVSERAMAAARQIWEKSNQKELLADPLIELFKEKAPLQLLKMVQTLKNGKELLLEILKGASRELSLQIVYEVIAWNEPALLEVLEKNCDPETGTLLAAELKKKRTPNWKEVLEQLKVPTLFLEPLFRESLPEPASVIAIALKLERADAQKVCEIGCREIWQEGHYRDHFEQFLDLYHYLEGDPLLQGNLLKESIVQWPILLRRFVTGFKKEKMVDRAAQLFAQQIQVPQELAQRVIRSKDFGEMIPHLAPTLPAAAIEIWTHLDGKRQVASVKQLLKALPQAAFGPVLDRHRKEARTQLREALLAIQPDHPELLRENRLANIKAFEVKDLPSFMHFLELLEPGEEQQRIELLLPQLWGWSKKGKVGESLSLLKRVAKRYPSLEIGPCLKKFSIKTANLSELDTYGELLQGRSLHAEALELVRRYMALDRLETALEKIALFAIQEIPLWLDVMSHARRIGSLPLLTKVWESIRTLPSSPTMRLAKFELLLPLFSLEPKWESEMREVVKESVAKKQNVTPFFEAFLEDPERAFSLLDLVILVRKEIPKEFHQLDPLFVRCALRSQKTDQNEEGLLRLLEWVKSRRKVEGLAELIRLASEKKDRPELQDLLARLLALYTNPGQLSHYFEKELAKLILLKKARLYSLAYSQALIEFLQGFRGAAQVGADLTFFQKNWSTILDLILDYCDNYSAKGGFQNCYMFPIAWMFFLPAKQFFENDENRQQFQIKEILLIKAAKTCVKTVLEEREASPLFEDWLFVDFGIFLETISPPKADLVKQTLNSIWEMLAERLISKFKASSVREETPLFTLSHPELGITTEPFEFLKNNIEDFWTRSWVFLDSRAPGIFKNYYRYLFDWAVACQKVFATDEKESDFYFGYILDMMARSGGKESQKDQMPYFMKLLELISSWQGPAGDAVSTLAILYMKQRKDFVARFSAKELEDFNKFFSHHKERGC